MPRAKGKAADGTYSKEVRREIRALHEAAGRVADTEGRPRAPQGAGAVSLASVVELERARGDGYFRVVCDTSLTAWHKWRFTSGRWEGHYLVVAQTLYQDASDAFDTLAEKLGAVDAGLLKPSWDKQKRG